MESRVCAFSKGGLRESRIRNLNISIRNTINATPLLEEFGGSKNSTEQRQFFVVSLRIMKGVVERDGIGRYRREEMHRNAKKCIKMHKRDECKGRCAKVREWQELKRYRICTDDELR